MKKKSDLITKRFILEEAYKLFLEKNFDSVTIGDIEFSTKKSRGTIFYYFDSKLDIFLSTVDLFLFPNLRPFSDICCIEESNFEDFISNYKNPCAKMISSIQKLDLNIDPYLAFVNYVSQAIKIYPSFVEKCSSLLQCNYNFFNLLLKKSQYKGEIVPFDNIVDIFFALSFSDLILRSNTSQNLMSFLYVLIKTLLSR